jgi:sec-independent protein translocase protein TatA
MLGLGFGELLVVFIIIVLIFGASRMAGLGKGLGSGIRNFKRALRGEDPPDDTRP